jgi:hypothetical protein
MLEALMRTMNTMNEKAMYENYNSAVVLCLIRVLAGHTSRRTGAGLKHPQVHLWLTRGAWQQPSLTHLSSKARS